MHRVQEGRSTIGGCLSYRFLKIASAYPLYLKKFYAKNPQIADYPYERHLQALHYDGFSWADFFTKRFCDIGVDATDIIHNDEALQSKWATEHGVNQTGTDLLFTQIKAAKPTVVFFQDSFSFDSSWLKSLRTEVPSIKLLLGWCCTNYQAIDVERFAEFDLLLTCSPGFVEDFERAGLKTHLFYHAFDAEMLERMSVAGNSSIHQETDNFDLLFAGSVVGGSKFHEDRRLLLESLISRGVNITIFGTLGRTSRLESLARQTIYKTYHALSDIGLQKFSNALPLVNKAARWKHYPAYTHYSRELIRAVREPVFGTEMYKTLTQAKTCLNIHADVAGDYACNMRLFEATGAGACLITDWKRNLPELFEPDEEIVSYKNWDECIEKVTWLMSHPNERKEIARKGQARALRDHSFKNRIEALDRKLRSQL